MLQKSFWYADLVLKKHSLQLLVLRKSVANYFFCGNTDIFFHDSLMYKTFKSTAFLCNQSCVTLWMSSWPLLINVMHPCRIKVIISFKFFFFTVFHRLLKGRVHLVCYFCTSALGTLHSCHLKMMLPFYTDPDHTFLWKKEMFSHQFLDKAYPAFTLCVSPWIQ